MVAVFVQIPHEVVRQVVASLTAGSGLEFKMPTDTDFIHKSEECVKCFVSQPNPAGTHM